MSIIPDEHREHLRNELREKLENPVEIIVFTQQVECKFCAETKQLVNELAVLNEKIKVEIHDFVADSEKVKEFGVDKVPAIVIRGKDRDLKFYGFPYGYEFQTLIDSVVATSKGKTNLSEQTKQRLREIKVPVHIQVLVTLTCPHCSVAAGMAYQFAMENSLIKADVIDVSEFPHLAIKYGVMGVPKIVINEKIEFVGAVPEDVFLEHVALATR
jgi:glutaredoxin-like protein